MESIIYGGMDVHKGTYSMCSFDMKRIFMRINQINYGFLILHSYTCWQSLLSPIVAYFDGWIVKWKIGLSPSTKLTNFMLEEAIKCLEKGETPICHSDRGFHYRPPSWIKIIQEAGLIRSMFKKDVLQIIQYVRLSFVGCRLHV